MTRHLPLVACAVVIACHTFPSRGLADEPPPEIPRVQTLEDLRGLKAVRAGDWDIRVGISDGGAESGPWELVYCHATYVGADAEPRLTGAGGFSILGPVSVRATYEPFKMLKEQGAWRAGPTGKEALFCQALPLLQKGTCVVDVLGPQEQVLSRTRIVVQEPRPCYWQTFAEVRRDGGRATSFVAPHPGAARPLYGGMTSLLVAGEPKEPAPAKEKQNQLPGAIPLDPRWKALGEVELSAAEGQFTIRSKGPKLLPRPERHLLARWWVNDKAVVPPPPQQAAQQMAEQVVHAQEMSVPMTLPASLGELKVGDRVGLQLLYTPGGFERLPPADSRWQHEAQVRRDEAIVVPLLSNRIEFGVTNEMLDAREVK